jgi:CelD/BcsL family acetyltransferase involved in cellulose biosynthesis
VLTASVIRELIERDGVTDLDFGRGDDPYKRAWTGQRRLRIGVLGLNPWKVAGLRHLARHDVGRFLRRAPIFWEDFRRRRAIAPSHANKR